MTLSILAVFVTLASAQSIDQAQALASGAQSSAKVYDGDPAARKRVTAAVVADSGAAVAKPRQAAARPARVQVLGKPKVSPLELGTVGLMVLNPIYLGLLTTAGPLAILYYGAKAKRP